MRSVGTTIRSVVAGQTFRQPHGPTMVPPIPASLHPCIPCVRQGTKTSKSAQYSHHHSLKPRILDAFFWSHVHTLYIYIHVYMYMYVHVYVTYTFVWPPIGYQTLNFFQTLRIQFSLKPVNAMPCEDGFWKH